MVSKIKTERDCISGADYFELAQKNGWHVEPNGSYWEIFDQPGGRLITRVPNSGRCLPKETRSTINAALLKAGLAAAVLGGLLLAIFML